VRKRYGLLRPFVMYTGGIEHRKNVAGLVHAYALLPKSLRENHQLAVVCSIQPDSRCSLAALARQQGLAEDELILTGFVPEEDLVALYRLCKAFVFPSCHEGFGLPALEAMSCGAAVIGASTSSLPEVIGREDALFDPFDHQSIAEKLSLVLTDNFYREALVRNGLEQARKFSWDESARRALIAFEQLHAARQKPQQSFFFHSHRPKLAYVSPLPPQRSGIADYSTELLPELARHYDIDVIVAQETITDPSIRENCSVRSADWFINHGHLYDRVLYHFGNSEFHNHMFALLARVPGVVVLHDFFLSGIVVHMDVHVFKDNGWPRELYHSHGYRAVQERFHVEDTADVFWKYPCNKTVVENAQGVIVHSEYSRRLARRWLGESFADNWTVIPHLRAVIQTTTRAEARQASGLDENAFIVCSFGLLGPAKQNHRLLDAWLASALSKDERCHLIFVGERIPGKYVNGLEAAILSTGLSDRIRITGWTEMAQFSLYLAAADMGVQLRTHSRGETSGTVLDCMKYGLPLIVNAHGSMADLPTDAVWLLPDEFADADLRTALESLWSDEQRRQALGARAREVILTRHAPRTCADQYAQAIEKYHGQAQSGKDRMLRAIAGVDGAPAGEDEWLELAKCIAQNQPPSTQKQLLVDVSELAQRDVKSGIQRVTRSVLSELLHNPPDGYRVEPVYATKREPGYRYARQFTLRFLKCRDNVLADEPVEAFAGDIFLGLDFQPHVVRNQAEFYNHLRHMGVRVYFLVHDLLPIFMPDAFSEGAWSIHMRWLQTVAESDGVICVSRAVTDDMVEWLDAFGPERILPLRIGWSHNGADLAASVPTAGLPAGATHVLDQLSNRPTFLMVGTIEPRKGHMQTLKAFERLWEEGVDVNLAIVGKPGWSVDSLVEMLRGHSEQNRRLFWLEGISDEYLEKVYTASACLIAASGGEGFGLPLIEAAQHKLPIITRDIPVSREVAGEHALYFTGFEPDSLADAVRDWLALDRAGKAPQSSAMRRLTWRQSTQNLLDVILGGNWYRAWMHDGVRRFWGADRRLGTRVGRRIGREIVTTGQAGYLIYGPCIPLAAGQYRVVIHGTLGENGAGGRARVELATHKGERVLVKSPLSKSVRDGCLVSLPVSLDIACTDLEVRLWVEEHSDVSISMLEIQPCQAPDVMESAVNAPVAECEDISPHDEQPSPPAE
jgi:glycosyltransferase involved in cell wall biosynthesis